ncbi:hypothetical protein Dform_00410 [Dehalogenimonas formicexedens]|uniref:Ig-like domain-containing protein n=1 Tax=Dehalogenimonas formicexedens TaxID=1839801 RepID=A0A1P8F5Q8_9CHLR|nr:YDG domain-containing protein [Dehalogenimonas formicexedens]APV43768.1 hypothetical protein Dform_00410 [Dehalogenimonas formicexedens]
MSHTSSMKRTFNLWAIPAAILLAATAIFALAFPANAQAVGTYTIAGTGVNANIDSAVDATGVTHVVYERGGSIYYNPGTTSATEEVVDTPPATVTDSHPAIAIGPDGLPQVVFAATDGQYYTKRSAPAGTAGTWSALVLIGGPPMAGYPDIAVNSANAPTVVFADADPVTTLADVSIATGPNQGTGTFDVTTLIWSGFSDATGGSLFSNPHIAVDSAGAYHVIANHESVTAAGVHSFSVIYDTNAGAAGNSLESLARASAANLSQNPITAAPTLGVMVGYDQAGSAYTATLGATWSEAVLGAFTQVSMTSDANMVAVVYVNGTSVTYALSGGGGVFSTGTLVAAGSNPSATLMPTGTTPNLSVYYLVAAGANTSVMLNVVAYPTVPPMVTTQPVSQSIVYGANAIFTAAANGLPAPTVQWQMSMDNGVTWMNIMGATTPTLTLTKPSVTNAMMPMQVRAAFSNGTTVNSAVATLTVTARPITVTAAAATKVYGAADPALTYTITVGSLAAGDTLSGSLARAAGENVGTYPINRGTLANTNYAITYFGASFTITGAPITVTADAKAKFYGDVDPALTYQITAGALVGTDTLTGALTRAAGETVGVYAISQGTLANTNYTITFVGANFTVNKATPVITWASPGSVLLGTVLSASQLNATATSPYAPFAAIPGTFNYNPSAGTALNVGGSQFLSLVFLPTDTTNYVSPVNATVTINVTNNKITPVIVWANPADIAYGTQLGSGQLNATANEPPVPPSVNPGAPVAGTFTYVPALGTVLGVGQSQTLQVTFTPTDTATYNGAVGTVTINVTKATLTPTVIAPNKVYDGTNSSTFTNGTPTGVVGTDVVTISGGTATFADANVGTGKTVTVTGLVLGGANAGNYQLSAAPVTATANITAKPLNVTGITAANKVYDRTTAATVSGTAALLAAEATGTGTATDGKPYTGDTVSVSGTAAGAFATATAGTAKVVNITGLTLGGTSAGNYSLTAATTTANITQKTLTITGAFTANNKTYDGSASATIGTNTLNLTGIINPDVVTLNAVAAFADATVGTGKVVSLTGSTLTGADAANYSILFDGATPTATADIAAAPAGGGGGGGGGGFGSQLIGINLAGTSPFMDGNGKSLTAGAISTTDGKLTLNIPVGVFIWNAAGAAQPFLSAQTPASVPGAPAQGKIVSSFEMGTTGVTFNPGINMVFKYTVADIAGLTESGLYIAWWDGTAWVKLTSTVDTAAKTVTATITHFTTFALIGLQAPPTTTPPPTTVPPTTNPPTTNPPTTNPPTTTLPTTSQTTNPPTTQPGGGTNWLLIGLVVAAALILAIVLFVGSRSKKTP